ncbi:MAG: arylmalonate decarboxylase [Alphaproteobacteria bacterium]|nr:arylmalonate decarboxylase [Alphaproteobacteria bacterium]
MFDDGAHGRAKIGYVLLATEQTIEDDVYRLRPDGVGVHFTRVSIPDSITVATLGDIGDSLAEAAALLLPDGTLDVVAYACTSGSVVLGEDRTFAELNRGAPKAKATSLITGVVRALRAVGAERIVIGTPYLDEINRIEAEYMRRCGFDILAIDGLNIERDSDMVRVAPNYIAEFAAAIDRPDADAVFISCGALRALQVVDSIETTLGKPVIVSNQAMIWDTLRLAGIDDKIDGYGRLFRDH